MKSYNNQNKNHKMKAKISSICVALLVAGAICIGAEKTEKRSAEFERMKSLVGTWTGKTDIGQGPIDMTVQYRLLAGGSVLEERCFAGSPNEMVTMYYEKGGKLAMTHYCTFGNRPGMLLKSSDENTLKFDFDELCGIDPKKESHMHSLSITFNNADTITTKCKAIIDGKETPEHPNTLKRVKS
jgi:hypothetical protein